MESTTYTIDGKEFELKHFGVKGMKWGRRKARPQSTGTGRRSGQATTDSPEAQAARKEARRAKAKRAAKIGAAVVAAGLAAYGAKKVHDVVRDKNYNYRMKKAQEYLKSIMNKPTWSYEIGDSPATTRIKSEAWSRLVRDVYDSSSRQADADSFGRALRNVVGDYLLDESGRRRR